MRSSVNVRWEAPDALSLEDRLRASVREGLDHRRDLSAARYIASSANIVAARSERPV